MAEQTSQTLILKGRLKKPKLPTDLVVRQRLIDHLNMAYHHPFTLISAPTGYGKSTLLSNWLENPAIPFAWLTLSEDVNDFQLFLSYLVSALRGCFTNALEEFTQLLDSIQNPPDNYLLTVFCEDLYGIEESFILILDDYHLITNAKIHWFIESVIENAPANMHVVIATRWAPALPLMKWRARGQMVELRGDQLLFQRNEVQTFLYQTSEVSLSSEVIEIFSARTEGWAAALRLLLLSMQASDNPETITNAIRSGTNTVISAYLLEQVYSTLPENIQDFLIKTSILDTFCADLCDALDLTTHTGSQEALEYLLRTNLFLIPLDEQGIWYRYHHLFRDDLFLRLKRNVSSVEIANLHRKAAAWLYSAGYFEKAINHLMVGGDTVGAATLIENHLRDLVTREDRQTLERWMRYMPEALIRQRPLLLLAKIMILHFQFRLAAISGLLDRVEDQFSQWEGTTESETRAKASRWLHFLRSQDSFWSGDWKGAILHGQTGWDCLLEDDNFAKGLCGLYLSLGKQMLGQGEEAIAWLENEIRTNSEQFNSISVRLTMSLAQIHICHGHLAQAKQVSTYLLENSDRHGFPIGLAWGRYLAGKSELEQGHFDQALTYFISVTEAPYRANLRSAHDCFLGLAMIYQAKGALQLADSVLDSAETLAIAAENTAHLAEINSFRARLALQRGHPELAFSILQPLFDTTLPTFPLIFLEVPHLTLARAWIASGEPAYLERATALLDQMVETATNTHNLWRNIEILAVRSLAYYQQGNEGKALRDLEQAVTHANSCRIVQMLLELRPAIQLMLKQLDPKMMTLSALRKIYIDYPTSGVPSSRKQKTSSADLTQREIEVLELLSKRLTYAEIAQTLVISPLTVKTHARNVYQKLGVRGRKEAVALARQVGFLKS